MKRVISFSVTEKEYESMRRYANKRRYQHIGHLALFCMERYMRQYPEFEGDKEIGLHLEALNGK